MVACTDADKTWSECTSCSTCMDQNGKTLNGHPGGYVVPADTFPAADISGCRVEARKRGHKGVGFRVNEQNCFFYDTIESFSGTTDTNHMVACTDADKTWSECTTCSSCT